LTTYVVGHKPELRPLPTCSKSKPSR